MKFEWDEEKNRENVSKHGIDFSDAAAIFASPMLIGLDDRADYGEERWIGIGFLNERVVVVVYTETGKQAVRIISLRKATSHERKRFEEFLKDRLEQG